MVLGKKLSGHSFCITGKLIYPRVLVEMFIESQGGGVHNRVHPSTEYLIIGEKPGKTKLSAHSKFKSRAIDEAEFWSDFVAPAHRPPLPHLAVRGTITYAEAAAYGKVAKDIWDISMLPPNLVNAYLQMKGGGTPTSASEVIKALNQSSSENGLTLAGAKKTLVMNASDEFVKLCIELGINLSEMPDDQVDSLFEAWGAQRSASSANPLVPGSGGIGYMLALFQKGPAAVKTWLRANALFLHSSNSAFPTVLAEFVELSKNEVQILKMSAPLLSTVWQGYCAHRLSPKKPVAANDFGLDTPVMKKVKPWAKKILEDDSWKKNFLEATQKISPKEDEEAKEYHPPPKKPKDPEPQKPAKGRIIDV
jgi:hypothetical protein